MKKFFITLMCIVMVVCFMPTVAMAGEGSVEGVINANPENIQKYLDGEYGSIDGKTIILSDGTYGQLELGRATKYSGSNTDYYIGGVADENKKTYEDFVKIKNNGQWSPSAYYVRNMDNVTIKAAEGANVKVAGLIASSGHVYGNVYDYVLDKAYTSGSAYYLSQNLKNITIEGITFTAKTEFSTSSADTVIDGVTFRNCTFNIGSTEPGEGTKNQALRYYNENNNGKVRNLTVENCSFNNCYQGVYTQKINGVTVMKSHFDTTGHNAIAVQSGSGAVNHKAVIITGNTFNNIGDRIIRFGDVGADTQITIKNNAYRSEDNTEEVMKAQSLAEKVTYDICGNNWGKRKPAANIELQDGTAVAEVGNVPFTTLEKAIAAATDGQTVTLLCDIPNAQGISVPSRKNFILDFAGHTYTLTGPGAGSTNTETNGFQLLKDSDITFKNGTIKIAKNANNIKRIIQNYANLKLEDMKFYAENQVGGENLPLSFNNGNIVFSGNTSIITSSDDTIAFDVYYWQGAYPNGTSVTFDNSYTGTINGKILYDSVDPEKAKLVINGNGSFGAVETSKDTKNGQSITISGGKFNTTLPQDYLAPGVVQDSKGNVYKPYYGGSIPTDSLKAARTEAIKAVSDYVNAADYEEAQQAEIKTIVDNAKKDIEAAKTADEIKAIEAAAKAELDKLETAEEMALIRTIEGTQFTARSKATTLNGKKAIRVTWNKPADLDFDGYEIYRSTERYKGYGTEPFFTTTNQKYTNNKGLKVGKTYYYKVRGFKYVNDEKVYTEYSLKAWRTVK